MEREITSVFGLSEGSSLFWLEYIIYTEEFRLNSEKGLPGLFRYVGIVYN